ncbi:hypothetical protein ABZ816_37035 [Actinosynnema sp. NPDC047251]|uniref:FHA domain-containing protein n=1 Tax=Saccharothrix espanaensis (strain ATCC 51144 / DSM 44229 / JCM 9112 / NBRC 15066 / NRRL 15764) TaxID=1179773 RepID=K0K6X4_SACES|nr:hypothetical protein [Saccharothrix espanaensis]CCH32634.1 hypothetical protein BN6_53740 [Saccharothrix espanaensis DSM 44229]
MSDQLVVRVAGAEHRPTRERRFTFGRSSDCDVCLDSDDLAISRLAGAVEFANELWWLINTSDARQLAVVDEVGIRNQLGPGKRVQVEGVCRVLVEGVRAVHELVLEGPSAQVSSGAPEGGLPTSIGAEVNVNEQDRAALVALFAGYLEEGDRYDPNPRSYAAAAFRLGWERSTLVKRVEYLRTRLERAGVPNMTGPYALRSLGEHVLTTRMITRSDLRLIRR